MITPARSPRKHPSLVSRPVGLRLREQCQGGGCQRDTVRGSIFGLRRRDRPPPAGEIHIAPRHRKDFPAPLPRPQLELETPRHHRGDARRRACRHRLHRLQHRPEFNEFVIGEDPLPRLLGLFFESRCGVVVEPVLLK